VAPEEGEMQPDEEGGRKRFRHAEYPEEDTIPFFPNYIILEVIVAYLVLGLLIVLASLFPAGLEEPADPFKTPLHIKPEWYFLWIYQFIKVPPLLLGPGLAAELTGIFIPAVALLLLVFLPFWDRNPERHPRRRPVAMALLVAVGALMLALSVWGWFS
jgi:quinol-cytochrome oxidoreductase complex cytochrome b subunit